MRGGDTWEYFFFPKGAASFSSWPAPSPGVIPQHGRWQAHIGTTSSSWLVPVPLPLLRRCLSAPRGAPCK